jgi:ferredoxin
MDHKDIFPEKRILYCHCGGERISDETRHGVEQAVRDSGIPATILSDLCGIAAHQKGKLADVFVNNTETLVIGCHRRTMSLLLTEAGSVSLPEHTGYINLLDMQEDAVLGQIAAFSEGAPGYARVTELNQESAWPAWYPVIDPSRCTNCGQCADFCLFGVYEKSEHVPRVVNPQGCKNNCPACARICPSTAIIFPKYKAGGAIGGSEEIDEQAEQIRQAKDIEHFLGDDLYEALERRKARRKSIIRESAMTRAMAERKQALETKPLH